MDPQGTKLGLSTFDPKEEDTSKRDFSAKLPCEVACDDEPSGGKDGGRMGNGLECNDQDKQTLL